MIIGSLYDSNTVSLTGSAYIFHREGSIWSEALKLVADDGAALDGFGVSVAISGDHIAIGAPYHDTLGQDSGALYFSQLQTPAGTPTEEVPKNQQPPTDIYFPCTFSAESDEHQYNMNPGHFAVANQ